MFDHLYSSFKFYSDSMTEPGYVYKLFLNFLGSEPMFLLNVFLTKKREEPI